MTASSNEFGDLIRRIRIERGLSQRDVAKALGVSHVYLSEVERGTRAPLTHERIMRFAELVAASKIGLLVAAAQRRSSVDVGGMTPEQIEAVVRYTESLRTKLT